ncbi:MAG: sigma-54-dependent Fis family transcriptional regulator [Phycisphaerales bacterium]|nr:sigma-54-dependent Fis family transcriptional regulator [Phycisphaerales bacterium]
MEQAAQLLISSADAAFVEIVTDAFGADVDQVGLGEDWPGLLRHIDPHRWQLLVLDVDPGDDRWHDWIPLIKPAENRLIAVMITASREAEHAVSATRHGFWDYLVKPVERTRLREVIADARSVLDQSAHFDAAEPEETGDASRSRPHRSRLLGQSPAMQEVYKQIGMIAPLDVDVLVTGESGTGKELVCRALHYHSPKKDGPFIAINCAAVPESLLESELFGHEKGAFTGADAQRIGRFEQAAGGTILLDEIGDMSPTLQAKLLRLIQDRTFYRVGGSELIRSDARVIAATNQVLEKRIEQGLFRQDLYYRLSVVAIHLPPLRDREVDAILIAHDIIARLNREIGRHITSFHPRTVRAILRYAWPGNVRELENVMKQAMVIAHGSVLLPSFLPEHVQAHATETGRGGRSRFKVPTIRREPDPSAVGIPIAGGELSDPYHTIARQCLECHHLDAFAEAVAGIEREIIRQAVAEHEGNLSAAARHLGITRVTLRRRMEQFNLTRSVTLD